MTTATFNTVSDKTTRIQRGFWLTRFLTGFLAKLNRALEGSTDGTRGL